MDIQRDIISKLRLTDQQKTQLAKLSDPSDISRFLREHRINVPSEVQSLLGGVAGATKVGAGRAETAAKGAAGKASDMAKSMLDKTDLDERLMDGIKGFGRKR